MKKVVNKFLSLNLKLFLFEVNKNAYSGYRSNQECTKRGLSGVSTPAYYVCVGVKPRSTTATGITFNRLKPPRQL